MPRVSRRPEVLTYLKANPTEFTIREVASSLGLSYDTTRTHLLSLASEGLITSSTAAPAGRGRPALTFMYVS